MKRLVFLTVMIFISLASIAYGKPLNEIIMEAQAKQASGDIDGAVSIMEKELAANPDNPTAMAYLGGYMSMKAGQASQAGDHNTAGEMTGKAFGMLDRAIEIDSGNVFALFHRGILGVNVPEFFGKLDQGVIDLEKLTDIRKSSPDAVPNDIFFPALDILGLGYAKQWRQDKAVETWQRIEKLAPGTPFAKQAKEKIRNLITSDDRINKTSASLSKEYPEIGKLAAKIERDPDNARLLFELANAYSAIVEHGYDKHIYDDQTYRTNIALEITTLLDKAVKLDPNDMQIRLYSGVGSVSMPFFVNRLERGIEDLEAVIASGAPDTITAEARFWLGYAYYKKAYTQWIKVISDSPGAEAADKAYAMMRPTMGLFDRATHPDPCVTVEFCLGFRDELAPQTAVWIEDAGGKYVRTLYVSGFSGYVKEKQVTLPDWAKSSKFVAVDGVTAASINTGHHLYVWDMKDTSGNTVPRGEYTVKVETSYWPSMKYQTAAVKFTVGENMESSIAEENDYIPYMKVVCYAE